MYPYYVIKFPDGSGIALYDIFILLGVIAALVCFRVLADRRKMPAKLQNMILIAAVAAVILGYLSAILFQAIYNAIETGKFELGAGTGSTFYGGLIGGAVSILSIYFIAGYFLFKEKKEHLHWFTTFANIAGICIPLAHGFGRIGCLTAGCCHGAETDAWYGVMQYIEMQSGEYDWRRVVPIQLFEAIFLFCLAIVLFVLFWKGKNFQFPSYLIGYGIWRFIVEYFRTDERGATLLGILTPSQLTAVIMVVIAIAMLIVYRIVCKKKGDGFFLPLSENANGVSADLTESEDSPEDSIKND